MALKRQYFETAGRKSGTCYLKIIMMETQQDTNATSKYLRDNLREMDHYIVKIDSDIIKFNDYVDEQIEGLTARGETTHDLLTNLFRAYKAASDKEFVRYIKDKETSYEDGTDMTSTQLMNMAKNRYKTMLQNGEWNSPTADETKIIALQAEMKAIKAEGKQHTNPNTNSNNDRRGKRNDARPAWQFVAPTDGEAKSKTIEGDSRQWHWCSTHSAWGRHTPGECKGKGFRPARDANANTAEAGANSGGTPNGSDVKETPAVRMAAALTSQLSPSKDDESQSLSGISMDACHRGLSRNLDTTFNLTRYGLPLIRISNNNLGRIIMVSSVTGPLQAMQNQTVHGTAYAALIGMVRSLYG